MIDKKRCGNCAEWGAPKKSREVHKYPRVCRHKQRLKPKAAKFLLLTGWHWDATDCEGWKPFEVSDGD